MLIALSVCNKDLDQAQRLAAWIKEIGPFGGHSLFIAVEGGVFDSPEGGSLIQSFRESFGNVSALAIRDDRTQSWPYSANHAFKKIAKEIEYSTKEPFLWIEPDAVPLHQHAFDRIEEEYRQAIKQRKPFLGDIVTSTPIKHMSGVGVYPGRLTHFAGEIFQAFEHPWDVVGAKQIVPHALQSEQIFHQWKGKPFANYAEVKERIFEKRPKCCLYHADKSGSLIAVLRAHRNGEEFAAVPAVPVAPELVAVPVAVEQSGGLPPIVIADEVPEFPPPPPSDKRTHAELWFDPVRAKEEIAGIVEQLARYASREGSHETARTRCVKTALHDAGIIKLAYRRKRNPKFKAKNLPKWKQKDLRARAAHARSFVKNSTIGKPDRTT